MLQKPQREHSAQDYRHLEDDDSDAGDLVADVIVRDGGQVSVLWGLLHRSIR